MALALETNFAFRVEALQFRVLKGNPVSPRHYAHVIEIEIGLCIEPSCELRVVVPGENDDALAQHRIAPYLIGQRQQSINRRIQNAGRQFAL